MNGCICERTHQSGNRTRKHMDPLILGQAILGKSPAVFYGYWMSAVGSDGAGAIKVYYVSGATKFTVKLQTKTSEDADNPSASADIVGSSAITGTGITRFQVSNAKEWVRYLVTADDVSTVQTMHFDFLPPEWVRN
jgi:hypothetical protein